jgi:hypothetical protein
MTRPVATTQVRMLRAPWWMYTVAAVYLLSWCQNARQEAFGPGSAGMLPKEPGLTVARVTPGSALDVAGVRVGDVIEAVDGRPLAGMSDWFLARAHFERGRAAEMQLRRDGQILRVWFTITKPNWRTPGNPAGIAVLALRLFVLLVGLFIAFRNPRQRISSLIALIFAMIAVAEGFPSAGWAAGLANLPAVLGLPCAMATASWLLMPVVWFSLCALYPQLLFTRRWQWIVALTPLTVFVPLIATSAIAFVYAPSALRMPSPFVDSFVVQRIAGIMGVFPQIFINLWPWYGPASETLLLGLWFVIAITFLAGGFAVLISQRRRLRDGVLRRKLGWQIGLLTLVWVIGIHNVLARNWRALFETPPPVTFGQASFVIEAVCFSLLAAALANSVRRHSGVET